ncbi:MAG: hypothetical protein P8X50_17000, partial [Maritimibacter sp.]
MRIDGDDLLRALPKIADLDQAAQIERDGFVRRTRVLDELQAGASAPWKSFEFPGKSTMPSTPPLHSKKPEIQILFVES